jgi:branched-chain amino acid transport system substrate-binding protein
MIRSSVRLLAILATLLPLLALAEPAKTIKIGFLASLSGPQAELGQYYLEGFKLGLEQLGNKFGGIPVDLIVADDQAQPEVGVQQVRKLLDYDNVDFMSGVNFSNVLMAVYKPIVEHKTFFFSSFSGPAPLAGAQCNPYFFATAVQNDQVYEGVGKTVADQPNVKKVFILVPNYQAGRDAVAGFKRYYKGDVVGEVYTKLNQPDYSSEIAQIRAARPNAVYFFLPGGMAVNFMKQYAGARVGIPLYSGNSVDEVTIHAIGPIAAGAFSAALYSDDLDNPRNREFVAAYREQFGRRPSLYAATAYDTVAFIDLAVRAVDGDLSRQEDIRRALEGARPELVRGPFRFNTNHFPIQNIYALEAVDENGDLHMKTRGVIFENHADAYAKDCPLK